MGGGAESISNLARGMETMNMTSSERPNSWMNPDGGVNSSVSFSLNDFPSLGNPITNSNRGSVGGYGEALSGTSFDGKIVYFFIYI